MKNHRFFPAGNTAALAFTVQALRKRGCDIAAAPGPEVTHLLLPVPSFDADGAIQGGGVLEDVLRALPPNITVMGGNLAVPALESYFRADLLQDPLYLSENAGITAHCAVKLALSRLPITMKDCPVLVIGWGRIGKCLASLLKNMGANVTVAARKPADKAMLYALGYGTEQSDALSYGLMRYRVIFNTVPAPVISAGQAIYCGPDCLKIDLASKRGIAGEDVLWARGLPGKDAAETSGNLIARTVIRLSAGKELE